MIFKSFSLLTIMIFIPHWSERRLRGTMLCLVILEGKLQNLPLGKSRATKGLNLAALGSKQWVPSFKQHQTAKKLTENTINLRKYSSLMSFGGVVFGSCWISRGFKIYTNYRRKKTCWWHDSAGRCWWQCQWNGDPLLLELLRIWGTDLRSQNSCSSLARPLPGINCWQPYEWSE